jgi:hypothetical protein
LEKYVLEVSIGQNNTAGQKAKQDITDILTANSFNKINIELKKSRLMKFLFSKGEVRSKFESIKKDDIFVMQYPMYSRLTAKLILKECKKIGVRTVCIIHDLESLRLYKNSDEKIQEELKMLKEFDVLISHNDTMSDWMKKNGVSGNIVPLKIFDYINQNDMVTTSKESNLIFAGNLQKSSFLKKWDIDKKLNLYGVNPSDAYPKNLFYKGVKTPDELPKFLSGSFGLVWDGTSMETNDGIYGEYTRYNNPHKVSLYLSAGLPVIVWKEAAISTLIVENNLGIAIDSLHELNSELLKIDVDGYNNMISNVTEMAEKLRKGAFTMDALEKAIDLIKKIH